MWHTLLALSVSITGFAPDVELPPGFAVERATARTGSFASLAFDGLGALTAGLEDGPILRLSDPGRDGDFEAIATLSADVRGARGLVWVQDTLYAVGERGAEAGVFRLQSDPEHARVLRIELLCPLSGAGERAGGGIALGPDGALYVAVGDAARLQSPPDPRAPRSQGSEGWLGPVVPDPDAPADASRWPYGFVARIDPVQGTTTYHSVGYHDVRDLAFDAEGELFTADVDRDSNRRMPWARGARLVHAPPLADFGARRGSSSWPVEYEDTLPGVIDLPRARPTGMCFGRGARYPERHASALFVGDAALGRILALHLGPKGASFAADPEVFALGPGVGPVSDVAIGPDGWLYWCTRGDAGSIRRVVFQGAPAASDGGARRTLTLPRANVRDDPAEQVSAALNGSEPCANRRACESLALSGADVAPHVERLLQLVVTNDRFVRCAAREALARLSQGELTRLVRRMLGDLESPQAPEARLITQCLFVFARTKPVGFESKDVVRVPLSHANTKHWGDAAFLRALELCSLAIGDPDARLLVPGQGMMQRGFPPADPLAGRIQARMLAHWNAPGAIDVVAKALAKDADVAQRVAWLDALTWFNARWTPEQAARAFAAAEAVLRAIEPGPARYVEALRDTIRSRLEARDLADLALGASRSSDPAFRLGPRTLAWIAKPLDPPQQKPVLAATIALHDALAADGEGLAERRATVAALGGATSAEACAWFRSLALGGAAERDVALAALARAPREEDRTLFLSALADPTPGVVESAAQALVQLGGSPAADAWSAALDVAQRLGEPRAWSVVALLCAWAGEPAGDVRSAGLPAALEAAEAAFAKRFPDVPRPARRNSGPR